LLALRRAVFMPGPGAGQGNSPESHGQGLAAGLAALV
jgi:hypothetical protein